MPWRFLLVVVALIAFGVEAFGHLIGLSWDFPLIALGLFCWLLSSMSKPSPAG